jgi:hypothetical protein
MPCLFVHGHDKNVTFVTHVVLDGTDDSTYLPPATFIADMHTDSHCPN